MSKSTSLATKIAAGAVALFAPMTAFASNLLNNINANATTTAQQSGLTVQGGGESLPTLVGNLIGAALGLLGLILVVYIIYAGFLWMTAQGNEENVKKAKAIIKNCVIGIVLIFAAYAISNFVLQTIVGSIA